MAASQLSRGQYMLNLIFKIYVKLYITIIQQSNGIYKRQLESLCCIKKKYTINHQSLCLPKSVSFAEKVFLYFIKDFCWCFKRFRTFQIKSNSDHSESIFVVIRITFNCLIVLPNIVFVLKSGLNAQLFLQMNYHRLG